MKKYFIASPLVVATMQKEVSFWHLSTWPINTKYSVLIVLTIIVIALIAYWIIKKMRVPKKDLEMMSGSQEADKPVVGYKHPCKYCDKMIPPNSTVCPLCGKVNPQGPMRCPKCHAPTNKSWQSCAQCGQNLRINCPKCGKETFFGDYCDSCAGRLTVTCKNCRTEQPPLSDKCTNCKQLLK